MVEWVYCVQMPNTVVTSSKWVKLTYKIMNLAFLSQKTFFISLDT